MMKQLFGFFLGSVLLFGISACAEERPTHDLSELQGDWQRISSNNPDADSMQLRVDGTSAIVLYAPLTSNFSNNELKWTNIREATGLRDFTLSDKSADNRRWEAELAVLDFVGDSILEFKLTSVEYRDAPGGEQTWVRK